MMRSTFSDKLCTSTAVDFFSASAKAKIASAVPSCVAFRAAANSGASVCCALKSFSLFMSGLRGLFVWKQKVTTDAPGT
jgi:hypothetical protein